MNLILRPFMGRPRLNNWTELFERVAVWVQSEGYGLIVFDTIASLWPVADENDVADVLSALRPLHMLTAAGAAVLLVHHPKKGDASEGQAARGSGALPGFVDVLVELRRYDASARDDRRRVLTAYSRFDETPSEVVLELGDDGYRTVGTRGDARQTDRLAAIGQLLPNDALGVTVDKLLAAWPETGVARPGRRTAQLDLQHGERTGLWTGSGAGNKGDPHRYRRCAIRFAQVRES